MSLTKFPYGIQAAPIVGGSDFAGYFDTKVWWVDGTYGSDDNSGANPTSAFKTIQKGITSAGSQDTVYIRTLAPDATDLSEPGTYEEDLTIPVAKHGLKLIGVGGTQTLQPFGGPKIKNATAVALLTVNASNVLIKGLQFNCTRNSGLQGILLKTSSDYTTAGGCIGTQIVDCYFKNASASYAAIEIEAGYACLVSRCTFQFSEKSIYLSSNTQPSNGHTIEYCNFKGNNGAAIAEHITVRAGGHEDISIDHCNFDAATSFLSCGGGNSGLISNCTFADTAATLANSTGKVAVPAAQTVKVTGCWGGVSLAVIQSAA